MIPISQYNTGTINIENGTNAIVGVGTAWDGVINAGDEITRTGDAVFYIVAAVADDTHLTITVNYAGVTGTGQDYAITTDFTTLIGIPKVNQRDLYFADIYTRAMQVIDAVLGGGYSGLITGLNTSALSVKDFVYISGNETWGKADATDDTKNASGIVTKSDVSTGTILVAGGLVTGFTGLVAGKPYFLSTTPGGYTATPDIHKVIQRLGIGYSTTIMLIGIQESKP